jgi:hypothetical protein
MLHQVCEHAEGATLTFLLRRMSPQTGTPRRIAAVRRFGRDRSEADMPRASEAGRSDENDPKATLTGSIPPALNRAKLSQRSPVLGRRHARGPPKCAGEARLRGKPAIESNLRERRTSRRDHRLGALQPPLADVAMWRHAHGGGKCAGEMKDAETRDIGKVGDG